MKRQLPVFILCISILFFIEGCKGLAGSCIKVGGAYKNYNGNIEYCFSPAKSEKAQLPILEDKEGKEHAILSREDIEKILKKIEDNKKKIKIKIQMIVNPYKRLKYYLSH